ncbi:hypothetical protein N9118_13250, partial [Akkermansiaceae bacterium]|nr:hypothetical protein [Akkermansiaceae bacterium]
MKVLLKKILPQSLIKNLQRGRAMSDWKKRDFLDNSPQLVKEKVFDKYGIAGAGWVETGTYLGTTTDYLSKRFPHVYSIEPAKDLYTSASKRFKGGNVTLFNDVSENIFPTLLPKLSGNINFWLDGHYSAGITFKGDKDCPVEDELNAIEANIDNFKKITILIDDVRCFLPSDTEYTDYPSIDYLVDWARRFNMRWRIEHDIFIMQK